VKTLQEFVEQDPRSKTAWASVGQQSHNTEEICKAIRNALIKRLRASDVVIGMSALIHYSGTAFEKDWPGDTVCFGPDATIFNQADFRNYRYIPEDFSTGLISDDPITGRNSEEKKALPNELSYIWKIRENVSLEDVIDQHSDDFEKYMISSDSEVTLCDETGIFARFKCSISPDKLSAPLLVATLAPDNLDLLEYEGRVVGLGCYSGDLFDTEVFSSNEFGSLAVIGDRTVEFLWGFRNKQGRPVLATLNVSYPSPDRLAKYQKSYPNGCGSRKVKLWDFGKNSGNA
jgi:hypothetical protein